MTNIAVLFEQHSHDDFELTNEKMSILINEQSIDNIQKR
jgi:hypothetical protein